MDDVFTEEGMKKYLESLPGSYLEISRNRRKGPEQRRDFIKMIAECFHESRIQGNPFPPLLALELESLFFHMANMATEGIAVAKNASNAVSRRSAKSETSANLTKLMVKYFGLNPGHKPRKVSAPEVGHVIEQLTRGLCVYRTSTGAMDKTHAPLSLGAAKKVAAEIHGVGLETIRKRWKEYSSREATAERDARIEREMSALDTELQNKNS